MSYYYDPTRERSIPVVIILTQVRWALRLPSFAKRGANVTLIARPVNPATPKNVHRIDVTTAHEMWQPLRKCAQKIASLLAVPRWLIA